MPKREGSVHRRVITPPLPPPTLLARVHRLGYPENFFVGLPDTRFLPPCNILMFIGKTRETPKDYLHHRFLLILNLTRPMRVLLDGCPQRVMPGQALLIFPFQGHRYLPEDDEPGIFLCITLELPEAERLENLKNRPVDVHPDAWQALLATLDAYRSAGETPEAADEVTALVSFILLRLLRQCRAAPALPVEIREPLPAHRLVQRAHRLIVARLDRNLAVGELARALAVSEGYLRACFRNVLGYSVSAGIRRTKVYHACSLLSRTEATISLISDRCGFGSVYAFSRAFKREIGMAPTRYRAHLWKDRNIVKARPRRPSRAG
jgi:AraC-like DNA-binding protein